MDTTELMKRSRAKLVTPNGDLGRNAQHTIDYLSRELRRLKFKSRQDTQKWIQILLAISTNRKEEAMELVAEVLGEKAANQEAHEFVSEIADMLADGKFTDAIDMINRRSQKGLKS